MMSKITPSVDEDYCHIDKVALPGRAIEIGASRLKWYGIAAAEDGIPGDVEAAARGFLSRLGDGAAADLGEAGFVILHRCGREFYFLLVQTWRNNNELWESVYARRSDAELGFGEFEMNGIHRGTFCVWELAAVLHERDAWRRYLTSGRTGEDLATYQADSFSGLC